jgi:hypothetical protein
MIVLGAGAAAVAVACSSGGGKSKNKIEPSPKTVAAAADTPAIRCDEVVPPAAQARLLPGRSVTHERSCADGVCFADTCTYRRDTRDRGVQVLYDCRAGEDGQDIRERDYFSTARKSARRLNGLGAQAAIDDEGLSFYDGDTRCLVTIRSGGDEQDFIELAHVIESNLR